MTDTNGIALIAVTRHGVEQARRLRMRLRAGEVHCPEKFGPTQHGWERTFNGALGDRVAELFGRCAQLVFFLATGAVTRLIAPYLVSKESDPGVLVVDEAGRFVIPLLSGHKGGANAFARTVAGALGSLPVITTASDVIGGLSLELLEEVHGWTAEPRQRLKETAAALVNGAAVAFVQDVGCTGGWLNDYELPKNVTCFRDGTELAGRRFERVVWVTDRNVHELQGVEENQVLWFRPPSLVLGVGCERGVSLTALEEGLDRFLREHRFARASIAALASADLKADESAIVELAQRHGWRTDYFPVEKLAAVAAAPNPSAVVARCVGTPGVAEPAALLAAGTNRLLVEKQVIASPLAPQRMTFALARFAAYTSATGTPEKVVFVGAGPGDPDLLTLKGHRTLGRADVVVYAGSLVPEEILRHAPATAVLHNSAAMTLEQVTERLIAAARAGKRVVRLHSGDTSLYSAIQEQMCVLDAAGIGYEIIPGVSSFQAAAAALQTELTLPEVVQTIILTRAEGQTPMPEGEALADLARHRATLCIFLSARLVDRVQEQLLTAYPADTPVAILHRVSWPDQKIIRTELQNLAKEMRRNQLTRTTLILIGAAVGGPANRSQLYDGNHGHLFRARDREETHPSA